MADQKISELTALTGANVADDDAIAIVDTSATETKKIVFSELKNALDTATGFVRITGDTMTGALDVQSTITSDGLTVDTDTLHVDATNNRVGIGTSSPSKKLHLAAADVSMYLDNTNANGQAWEFKSTNGASASTGALQLKDEDGHFWMAFNENAGSNYTQFLTNNAERMRIDSSGHAIIPAGVTLGTSAGTYAAANTLDDYEEGTWTPTIQGSATAGTYTPSTAVGKYTKVGRAVHLEFYIQNFSTASGGSGYMRIEGLPFAKVNASAPHGSIRVDAQDGSYDANAYYNTLSFISTSATSIMYINVTETSGSSSNFNINQVGTGTDFFGSITYFT